MTAARSRRRIAQTTVAVTVAGTVAFAPLAAGVAPALAQEAASAGGPLDIRVGANDGFTRVEFAGVIGARSRVRQDGRQIVVRMGVTAAPDVSRLKVSPPPGVEAVETRAAAGATELVLTLAEGAEARSGVADGAVWLNLYAPGAAPSAAAAPAAVGGVVPVTATAGDAQAVLRFQWSRPVGAAVFRRGEAVWVVFDAAARLDMTGAKALGPATGARWAPGPDFTAVRLAAAQGVAVRAAAEGSTWVVTLGGAPSSGQGVEVVRAEDGEPALTAVMAGATKVVWLTDPMVGDRFAAVTALPPGKGFGDRRQTVDMTLLPSAQGLAVETAADDLAIVANGDLVRIGRPRGLTLSDPSALLETAEPKTEAPRKAPFAGLILPEWAELGHAGFAARHRELQDAALAESARAADDPRAPAEARLALARFLVASGLSYEAIGVLDAVIEAAPAMLGEAEVRGLRGAARAAIGRLDAAAADLAAGSLAGDPAARVWQGYIAAQQGDWDGARKGFAAGAGVIDQFAPDWRARFGAAHALAALETGDPAAARALLAYSFAQDAPAADQLQARLVQARLFEIDGEAERALRVYKAVARAPLDGIATPARLGVVRLELASGAIKPNAAAAELESLKWRWRGDATELAVIKTLGDLYISQGRYREALDALRGAGKRMGRLPGAAELQLSLSNAFKALFLDGGADGLQPIQALALFYDFRELTPVGADGDEMVRRLSRRLIDVDLLDQAAELLKHQVDNRLDGVAKAQVATDLAAIYLMDRQPEPALQAIWQSRTTLLPSGLNAERRALEARALAELGRFDHALEVLGTDASPAARDVKADILWKQQKWGEAAALYDARLGDRHADAATPLSMDEESRVIRAGVGYSLARDAGALGRLSGRYAPFQERARQGAAMRIALDGLNGMAGEVGPGDFTALTAGADTFAGWVAQMKQQLRDRTGGSRPATPARPAA